MSKLTCALTKTSRKRAGISYPPTVIILIFIISCCRGIRYTYPRKPDACCLSPSLFRKASGTQVSDMIVVPRLPIPQSHPLRGHELRPVFTLPHYWPSHWCCHTWRCRDPQSTRLGLVVSSIRMYCIRVWRTIRLDSWADGGCSRDTPCEPLQASATDVAGWKLVTKSAWSCKLFVRGREVSGDDLCCYGYSDEVLQSEADGWLLACFAFLNLLQLVVGDQHPLAN